MASDLPPLDPHNPEVEIPQVLHSAYSGKAFRTCVDCGGPILESGLPYSIEKVVRQGEVIFEYALCMRCAEILMHEFSEESLRNIAEYLEREELELGVLEDTTACHRCGRRDSTFAEEYTVTGMLIGTSLMMGPLMVCAPCLEGMESVLSKQTREAHGHFIEKNFPGVPEYLGTPLTILGS